MKSIVLCLTALMLSLTSIPAHAGWGWYGGGYYGGYTTYYSYSYTYSYVVPRYYSYRTYYYYPAPYCNCW